MDRIVETLKAKNYLLAGNSTFNVISHTTGSRFLVKIKKSKKEGKYFVYGFGTEIRTLNDTYKGHFIYIGPLYERGNFLRYYPIEELQKPNKLTATVVEFLVQVINNKRDGILANKLELLPSNTCCKCGLQLTTPESIKDGIGPICKKGLLKQCRW